MSGTVVGRGWCQRMAKHVLEQSSSSAHTGGVFGPAALRYKLVQRRAVPSG